MGGVFTNSKAGKKAKNVFRKKQSINKAPLTFLDVKKLKKR